MKRNGKYDRSLSTRASEELRKRVIRQAKKDKRSMSNMINVLLEEALGAREHTESRKA